MSPATPAQALDGRPPPPPQPCRVCGSRDLDGRVVLAHAAPAVLRLSHDGAARDGWRWTCLLCGAVREEPAR